MFKFVNDNVTIYSAIRVYVPYLLSGCDSVWFFYGQVLFDEQEV